MREVLPRKTILSRLLKIRNPITGKIILRNFILVKAIFGMFFLYLHLLPVKKPTFEMFKEEDEVNVTIVMEGNMCGRRTKLGSDSMH